ncbi:hypothetical protein [Methylobacterium sp. GXS13]|uniref:hypothetical protein n=1 Tax=Methylobacterium sp. GXS13 TaxID=1730094 RepID=UPI001AEC920B|nr:hypothetical protein [Methylobacterium sp. GXS13]
MNAKWPPINVEQQRRAAIDSTAQPLSQITSPSVAFSLALADAQRALLDDKLREQGIVDLRLEGAEQLLHVRATFKRKFAGVDAGANSELAKILDAARPEITGSIDAYAGITGGLIDEANGPPVVNLSLLPALSSVQVDSVVLAEKIGATAVVDALVAVLNIFKDNISGELSRQPFTKLTVPALSPTAIDPSKSIIIKNPAASLTVRLKADKIVAPFKLGGIAWLVTDNQVVALVQLTPTAGGSETAPVTVGRSFGDIRDQIDGLIATNFGLSLSERSSWAAVRKDLIANTINSGVTQANLCVSVSGATSRQTSSTKIDLPSGDAINCTPNRECSSNRSCDFAPDVDNRDCDACILSRPKVCAPSWAGGGCVGGGCIQRGRDPICAFGQGVQNDLYRAVAAGKKFDCERLKAQEKASCEIEKSGEKLLCETGKQTLTLIKNTGKFANLDVTSQIKSEDLGVCIQEFNLSTDLSGVSLALDVSGRAQAVIDVKFTPLDIVGHLACQWPWTESQTFEASLKESRIPISSAFRLETPPDGQARAVFSVKETIIKADISPGPTEFLLTKSPNMTLSCQGLNLIKPIVLLLTPFVPQLRGDIETKLPSQEISADLNLPVQRVREKEFSVSIKNNRQAIVAIGQLLP